LIERRAIVVASLLCALWLGAASSHRAQAEAPCPVPAGLALRDIALPDARRAAAADGHLVVLTFGGVMPATGMPMPRTATYPGRLAAELSAALPAIKITVENVPPPCKTAADVPAALPGLIEKTGARLVIWGPGSRDAAARLDLGAFSQALNLGIQAVRQAGADLILLDTTFVPSPARMTLIEGYRQRLLSVASANRVPLLHRHDMMRRWSEDGTLNMAAREPAEQGQVARHLYSCVARALAEPIAAAVR